MPDPKTPMTSIAPRTLPVSRAEADQLRAIGYADDGTPPVNGTGDDRPTPLAAALGSLDAELAAKRAPRAEEDPGYMAQLMSMLGMGP